MTPQHPRDLDPYWFAEWEERAAIMGEALDATIEGRREANRRAFADVLRQMKTAALPAAR
jgi:hypothetical protein